MHNINGQVPLHDQHGYSKSDGAAYFFLIYYDNFLLILLIQIVLIQINFINSNRDSYIRRFADLSLRLVFYFFANVLLL